MTKKEYAKAYYWKNREKILKRRKEIETEEGEVERKEYHKEYYKNNKEKILKQQKDWKIENRDKWNEYQKDWSKKKYWENKEGGREGMNRTNETKWLIDGLIDLYDLGKNEITKRDIFRQSQIVQKGDQIILYDDNNQEINDKTYIIVDYLEFCNKNNQLVYQEVVKEG